MTTLALCHEVHHFDRLRSVLRGDMLRVASDNPLVHSKAAEDPRVIECVFIEQADSMYSVSEDVEAIRLAINDIVHSLNRNVSKDAVEWISWAEGGSTTQKIQDALLLVRSYLTLLRSGIDSIVMIRSKSRQFEDRVLIDTACSLGIRVKQYWEVSFVASEVSRALGLGHMWLVLNTWFKALGRFVATFGRKRTRCVGDTVVFLLNSSSPKHIENARVVMNEFRKNRVLSPFALCWNATAACAELRHAHFCSENLEAWIGLRDFVRAASQQMRTILLDKFVRRRRGAARLSYRGVSLASALNHYISGYICSAYFDRLLVLRATERFLNSNEIVALKTWGENIMEFGRLFSRQLRDQRRKKPSLVFHYSVGIGPLEYPYYAFQSGLPNLVFVNNEREAKVFRKIYDQEGGRVVISGFARADSVSEFKSRFNREQSEKALGLQGGKKVRILYVSNHAVRGFFSRKEHYQVAESLMEFARNNQPNIEVLVKPHPAEPEAFWKELVVARKASPNFILIQSGQNPYHCVHVSDVVLVLKFSTLSLESMMMNKPVVAVDLDYQPKLVGVFEGGVETVYSIDELRSFLSEIAASEGKFSRWREERLLLQAEFLATYFPSSAISPSKIISDVVTEEVLKLQAESGVLAGGP